MTGSADGLPSPAGAALLRHAAETFGSEVAGRAWCEREHPLLNWKSPLECCEGGEDRFELACALLSAVRYGGAA